MPSSGTACRWVEPVDPAARWGDMRARFLADENLTAILVLNPAGRVLRVLMRSQVLAIASGRFGFSLLDGRTISDLLDLPACNQPPLTCASGDDLIPVAERILQSGAPWYETAIAVFDGRRYCGILTYPALVAAMLEISRQHAVEVDPAVPERIIGDPRRFRQVITNLAGNAVKFTRQGRIDIRLGRSAFAQPNRIELVGQVTDTGPGIAPDVLRRLFTPFVQGDESLSRAHGGFGLGLAITRHLLELMGGSITCESQPNRGSCFRFSFHCAHETQVATTTPRTGAPFV